MRVFESEVHAIIALNRITYSFAPSGIRIQDEFDSVLHFLEEFEVGRIDLPASMSNQIIGLTRRPTDNLKRQIDKDLTWLQMEGHGLVSIFDAEYPALLKHIHDPPLCLFMSGNAALIKRDQLAIVGSRKPTRVGLEISTAFAASLSELGIVITSGLAFGIDAAAHDGALKHAGETIAVLATGCDLVYPRYHERLAMRIIEQGLMVSELPLGTKVRAHHFPQRNRIVTGLSLGTLVVEAALKSGSLISARLAMEQSREVFAVPGSIYSKQSSGCHQLIKDGAKLTQTLQDIVEELQGYSLEVKPATTGLSDQAQEILQYLSAEPVSIDALVELSGIAVPELLALLVSLEIDDHIVSEARGYVLSVGLSPV